MKTLQDLRAEYKQDTGLEVNITAYGFRLYLAWLEEKTVKMMNRYERMENAINKFNK